MTILLPKISSRALLTPPSPIRKLSGLANRAKMAGRSIYHLNIGQPDLFSPNEFFEGVASFKQKVLAYEDSRGMLELREVWSNYFNSNTCIQTDPNDFLITTGASEALIFAFNVCCDADDEVLVFDPSYANYMSFAAVAGVNLVPVRTEIADGFCLPSETMIYSHISDRTKAILLCNPNNPTGTHCQAEDLLRLIRIANERNIFLIVDETYREFVFDGRKPVSVLEVTDDPQRIIVIDSLSKRFSLCGARIGCLLSKNHGFLQAALALAQARLSVSTIDQFAAAFMLARIDSRMVVDTRNEYQRRRDCLKQAFNSVPGAKLAVPQGAFYAIAELPVQNAEEFAIFLLERFSHNGATTFVAPAEGFYFQPGRGRSEIRVAYVLKEEDIKAAIEIIKLGLEDFNREKSE